MITDIYKKRTRHSCLVAMSLAPRLAKLRTFLGIYNVDTAEIM